MLLAYIDESGDPGLVNSPVPAFSLSCILIDDRYWLDCLDASIAMRRLLRKQFKIPMRTELKANWIVHSKKSFAKMRRKQRINAYRQHMHLLRKLHRDGKCIGVFSIVIDKGRITTPQDPKYNPRRLAWRFLIQRLERAGRNLNQNVMLFPDEGHTSFIRATVREMRRHSRVTAFYGGPPRQVNADNIIEDPNERNSSDSYFVQMADMCAYASYRACFPVRRFGPAMWNELGGARIAAVNRYRGGPSQGIVKYP